jgi:heat shock protein HslJ
MLVGVVLVTMACVIPNAYTAQTEAYRGFYVFGHEVRTFQPCGSEQVYWVKAEPDISKRLREEHRKLTVKPYESIYVEVQGHLLAKATEGFAADYDSKIAIEAIDLVRAKQKQDCSAAVDAGENLIGVTWIWQQTRYNNDTNATPQDPSRYTIAFKPDGALNIRADCNRAGGKYTMQKSTLTIEVTHSTRAACPPDSLEQTFLRDLNSAAIYFIREGYLYIDLKYDSGTMQFSR